DLELAATSGEPDILNLEIHLRRSAVSDRPAANVGKNLLDVRVLHADDGGAIEWDLVNEIGKGRADFVNRGVMVQMLPVDICQIATIGASFRKEPSLSSDSTTRNWLLPIRAFEPPIEPTR